MIREYLSLVLQSLSSRRVRSWLTMLGILIGITAVVSLISLGYGMQESITNQFQSLGSNRLLIAPGGEFIGPGTADLVSATLDDSDISVLRQVTGVTTAQGVLVRSFTIEADDKRSFSSLFAFNTDPEARRFVESVGLFDVEERRELKSGDKFKAVLGFNLADTLDAEVGTKILIDEQEFDVVGVQRLIGTGIHDGIVRIPQETLRDMTATPKKLSMIFALTGESFSPREVAEDINKALRSHRSVKKGEEDFNVQTADQTINQSMNCLSLIAPLSEGEKIR